MITEVYICRSCSCVTAHPNWSDASVEREDKQGGVTHDRAVIPICPHCHDACAVRYADDAEQFGIWRGVVNALLILFVLVLLVYTLRSYL
jgi:hypothetical protein